MTTATHSNLIFARRYWNDKASDFGGRNVMVVATHDFRKTLMADGTVMIVGTKHPQLFTDTNEASAACLKANREMDDHDGVVFVTVLAADLFATLAARYDEAIDAANMANALVAGMEIA